MTRQNWAEGQVIASDDLNDLAKGVEQTILEQVLANLLQANEGFVDDAFKVMRATATTFTVTEGLGIYTDATQTAPESKLRLLYNKIGSTIYTITNPHGSLTRLDIVQVRFKIENEATASRDIKDGLGAVAPATVPIRKKWTFELQIKDGTASGSPVAPSPDSGWTKIATMTVSPGATGIANQAAIADNRTTLYLFDEVADAIQAQADALTTYSGVANGRLTSLETYTSEPTLQTSDLWAWDLPLYTSHVTSVNNNSNDLDIKRTGTAGAATFAGAFIEITYGSMLLELQDMFGRGLGLKILDGSANVWLIVPILAGVNSYFTHAVLSGGMVSGAGGGTCTFKLKSTGIGVVYNVYRNGVAAANFSAFVTNTSFSTSTFRVVAFGTSKLVRGINGLIDVSLLKKRYVRVWWPMNNGYVFKDTTVLAYKMTFRTGITHRAMLEVMPYGFTASTCYQMFLSNHLSSVASSKQVGMFYFDMNNGDFSPGVIQFTPAESDLNLVSNQGSSDDWASGRNVYGTTTDMGSFYGTNKWNIDKVVVEEV